MLVAFEYLIVRFTGTSYVLPGARFPIAFSSRLVPALSFGVRNKLLADRIVIFLNGRSTSKPYN